MQRKAIILAIIACMMLSLCSCSRVEKVKKEDDASMFVKVETTRYWEVVYHKDTKVMYAVSNGTYNYGTFTLLVDADGKPMIYEGVDIKCKE